MKQTAAVPDFLAQTESQLTRTAHGSQYPTIGQFQQISNPLASRILASSYKPVMHPGTTYVRFLTFCLKLRELPALDWAGEVYDRWRLALSDFAAVNLKL